MTFTKLVPNMIVCDAGFASFPAHLTCDIMQRLLLVLIFRLEVNDILLDIPARRGTSCYFLTTTKAN